MKLFKLLVRAAPGHVAVALVVSLVAGAASVGLVRLISGALAGAVEEPAALATRFAVLAGAVLLSKIVTQTLLLRASRTAALDLRLDLSERLLQAPLRHLEEIGTPRQLAALSDDVVSVRGGLLFIPEVCLNGATLLACLAYLAWLSWPVLLGVLAFLVVGVSSYQVPVGWALRSLRRAREEQETLFAHFRALTDGAKELKLNGKRREAFLTGTLKPTVEAVERESLAGMTIYMASGSWGQVLFLVGIGLLLVALPALGASVHSAVLSGFVVTILFATSPLETIMRFLPTLGQAAIALDKVDSLGLALRTWPGESPRQMGRSLPPVAPRRLELVGVTHAYRTEREDDRSFTLGPVDLTLEPGELVFLVGGNGSGKTTLAKVVTGLYVPEAGEVRLGGEAVTEDLREWYRQHFSAVFSDSYVFESLAGTAGNHDLDAQATHYLRQLHLEHKVVVQGGALSTTKLSQGQRKRLALLAAYLEDRPFYLFDEWAADQDPMFKDAFYRQILPELKTRGKAVLVITHDEKYFDVADRVIKLAEGRVATMVPSIAPVQAERLAELVGAGPGRGE